MLKKVQTKKEAGQTLFELIMAIAVGVVIVTAIVAVATISIKNSSFAKLNGEATRYSQETIEWLRTERDKSWTTLYSKSGVSTQTYCLTTLGTWPGTGTCGESEYITGTFFKREVQLTQTEHPELPGSQIIEAVVMVYWADGTGTHQSRLATQLSDWILK